MTFQESVRTCFVKYVDFTGRATRSEYWWFVLFNLIVAIVLSMISQNLSLLWSLATLLPGLAVGVRRLHDTNRSGWWMLVALVPVVGSIVLLVFFAQESKSPSTGEIVSA